VAAEMTEVTALPVPERRLLTKMISPRLPGDALASYYALNHPAERLMLYVVRTSDGDVIGFLVSARTGGDLFRPLVIPLATSPEILERLLRAALLGRPPVLAHLPADQEAWVPSAVEWSDSRSYDLYRLDPSAFRPEINVLVTTASAPDGLVRTEVRSGRALLAAAGLNWKGDAYAEVYVEGTEEARSRGLTRSTLSSLTAEILKERVIPLLYVDVLDTGALAEAHWVGYRKTGDRYVRGQMVWRGAAQGPRTA
jgi:hypothetical protein